MYLIYSISDMQPCEKGFQAPKGVMTPRATLSPFVTEMEQDWRSILVSKQQPNCPQQP